MRTPLNRIRRDAEVLQAGLVQCSALRARSGPIRFLSAAADKLTVPPSATSRHIKIPGSELGSRRQSQRPRQLYQRSLCFQVQHRHRPQQNFSSTSTVRYITNLALIFDQSTGGAPRLQHAQRNRFYSGIYPDADETQL
jgi:hypothetical protein